MKNITRILILSTVLLIGLQAVAAFQMNYGFNPGHPIVHGGTRMPGIVTPINPLTAYIDPTVRTGGFFGNSELYLAGLRGGIHQEPHLAMNYGQRVGLASAYYPHYPLDSIRQGGYYGERGVNLKGSPNAPGTFVFGGGRQRFQVYSGFN